MDHKKLLVSIFAVSFVYLSQGPAYAWFLDFGARDREHHDRHHEYTEVRSGGDRYYYKDGNFYRGGPGNYVIVSAPIGATIYSVPADFERVDVNGGVYYRHNDVYYRQEGRGYRVIERPRQKRDFEQRDERHDERRDARSNEHHDER